MTIVEAPPGVTGGVDTHLDDHVAAALDPLGRLVGTESFEANAAGFKALVAWLESFGHVSLTDREFTGTWSPQGFPSVRASGCVASTSGDERLQAALGVGWVKLVTAGPDCRCTQ